MFQELERKNKGFSLIEIMVVISIIGILVSIVTMSFDSARKTSRDKARMAELKEVQLALELYKSQNGRYPAAGCSAGSNWSGPGPGGWTSCEDYITSLVPSFIPNLPKDPNQEYDSGEGYLYRTNSNGDAYKLIVYRSVENNFIEEYEDEFARCPYECGNAQCGADFPRATIEQRTYAVYSEGAACW
jgi:prepilin-type N-terminal cleavage/methylation domain-containing protein